MCKENLSHFYRRSVNNICVFFQFYFYVVLSFSPILGITKYLRICMVLIGIDQDHIWTLKKLTDF